MTQDNEQYLVRRNEYYLRVPKVPCQIVDVFGRDVKAGNYGLSAEKIQTIQSYIGLQHTLGSFDDLTFSSSFIDRLPEQIREKLSGNLQPEISLSDLEIPTTDKVLLARMLAADRLTETLSSAPPEVWITASIKEELKDYGLAPKQGLQVIDYATLSVNGKMYLLEVMERQEFQVHTILAARQRFPDGIPPLGFSAILKRKKEWTKFDSLLDLEGQFEAAQQALDNPLLLWFSGILQQNKKETKPEQPESRDNYDPDLKLPLNVEEEAKGAWWKPTDTMLPGLSFEDERKIADFLRPRYINKTIYEIFGANTAEEQEEILSAFWRTDQPKQMDFGDEPWLVDGLYLRPDGILETYFQDELWNDHRDNSELQGELAHPRQVAMVDQTVKWIKEEMAKMEIARKQWEKSGFPSNPAVEVTLVSTLRFTSAETEKELEGLPKWFLNTLYAEVQYFESLITYHPKKQIEDVFDLLFSTKVPKQNWLKSYFDQASSTLEHDRRLITNPSELYADLNLEPTASLEEVRRAYRKVAKETKPIFISSSDEFEPEEWEKMNNRFISATRAYTAICHRNLGESRITTLGKLSSYFGIRA